MKKFHSPLSFASGFMPHVQGGFNQFQFITTDALHERLAGKMEVRSNESVATVIAGIEEGQTIQLAPDVWTYSSPLVITKSCSIIGHPLGTKIKRGEGLTSGPMVSVEADNVVLKNIYFEDDTSLTDVDCIGVTDRTNLVVSECVMSGFSRGINNSGGDNHTYAFNSVSASTIGIDVQGEARFNRITANQIVMTPDTVLSVSMGSSVSATAVTGNVCNSGISFHNTGSAQTFSSPGGLSNHVAGNVAALTETT
tara:strand:+ start:1964 stop:2722 length:759 start_codon:yes stop_codon:yes gene_type:complete